MKYLNRQNKENLVMISCLNTVLGNVIKSWDGNIDTKIMKRIKTAFTNLDNVVKMIVEGIDKDQYDAIKKSIKHLKTVVMHDDEIHRNYRLEKEMAENRIINKKTLDDILEVSMNNCIGCKKDVGGCKINKLYRELDAPVYDETADCPWRI